jgi:hypothetical protein
MCNPSEADCRPHWAQPTLSLKTPGPCWSAARPVCLVHQLPTAAAAAAQQQPGAAWDAAGSRSLQQLFSSWGMEALPLLEGQHGATVRSAQQQWRQEGSSWVAARSSFMCRPLQHAVCSSRNSSRRRPAPHVAPVPCLCWLRCLQL